MHQPCSPVQWTNTLPLYGYGLVLNVRCTGSYNLHHSSAVEFQLGCVFKQAPPQTSLRTIDQIWGQGPWRARCGCVSRDRWKGFGDWTLGHVCRDRARTYGSAVALEIMFIDFSTWTGDSRGEQLMSFCVLLCAYRSGGGRVQQLSGDSTREGRAFQRVTVRSKQ